MTWSCRNTGLDSFNFLKHIYSNDRKWKQLNVNCFLSLKSCPVTCIWSVGTLPPSIYLWCSIDLTPRYNLKTNKWISKYLSNVQKCKAEMIPVNQTWLKLRELRIQPYSQLGSFIVLNKLQKSGKAKITQVTLQYQWPRDRCKAFKLESNQMSSTYNPLIFHIYKTPRIFLNA